MNKLYYRMLFLSIISFNTLIQSMQNNNYNMINSIMDSVFFKEFLQTFPRYWSIARSLEVDTTCTATEKNFNLNKKPYVKIKELMKKDEDIKQLKEEKKKFIEEMNIARQMNKDFDIKIEQRTKEKNKFDYDIKNNDGSIYKMHKNNYINLKLHSEKLHNKINEILNKISNQEYFKINILEIFNILVKVEKQEFSEYTSIISINSAEKKHAEKFLATLGLNKKWGIVTHKQAQYFIKKTEDTDITNEIEITLKGVVNTLLGEKDTVIKDLEIELETQEEYNQYIRNQLRDYKTFNPIPTGFNLEERCTLMYENKSIKLKQLHNKIKHIRDKIINQEYFKTNILEIFNILVEKQEFSEYTSIISINSAEKKHAEKFLATLGLNEKWGIVTHKQAQYSIEKTEDTDITNEIEENEEIPVKPLADYFLGEKNKIIDDLEDRLNYSLKELESIQQICQSCINSNL